MLNIVLFGPPGAGKGTQAEKLQAHYGIRHLSTGEVIRQQMSLGTALGRLARRQMVGGRLAADGLVIGIIEHYLAENREVPGVIFDGFPRTLPQAEAFDRMLTGMGQGVTVMLALEVCEQEVIKRIQLRGQTSGRADDQSVETIRNRIKVYEEQTAVVADYYRRQGKYRAVPGEGGIEPTFELLCRAIDQLRK